MNRALLWAARAVADGIYGDGSVSVDDIIGQAIGRPMIDIRNDPLIMRARTMATGRGATPPEIQRNILALECAPERLRPGPIRLLQRFHGFPVGARGRINWRGEFVGFRGLHRGMRASDSDIGRLFEYVEVAR